MSYLIFLILFILCFLLASLSLYLIYRYEDLEGLARARAKSLLNAEMQITERNKLLEYQENKIKKQQERIKHYEDFISSNNYSNAETRLNKLKELVSDYQSQNQF